MAKSLVKNQTIAARADFIAVFLTVQESEQLCADVTLSPRKLRVATVPVTAELRFLTEVCVSFDQILGLKQNGI